ncbi:MAG: SusC/RagA family TonB-linked outer membrane protein [Bacteroidota bacterium]
MEKIYFYLGEFRRGFTYLMTSMFISCLLVWCSTSVGFSQSNSLKGKIINQEDNSPLPGASVQIKGTNKGSSTNANGEFILNGISNGTRLVISSIGMVSQEIVTDNRTELSIVMLPDTKQLAEIVFTALGISKDKRSITNSVQSVKGDDMVKAREPNPINSLAGKIAGLTVGASTELLGRPNLVLRGQTDMLYVVDGVPINSDTYNISADDIDNYSVLKGATAAALYGFRGKNGAILITTKKGTKDKRGFSVDFNSSTMFESGFNALPKTQDLYGPGDHGIYEFVDGRGGGKNDGDYDIWGPKFEGQLLPQYDSPIDPVTGKRVPTPWTARGKDNLSRFIQTGVLSTNNVAVASSGENYDVRFSVSNNYTKGLVPNTKLNVNNFNIASGINLSKKIRFETNINYSRQSTDNFPDLQYGPNSPIYTMTIWGGADWDVDDMKNYWQEGKEGIQQIYAEYQRYNNPWFISKEWLRGHYKNDIYGYASLNYKLTNNFELMGRTSITTYDVFRNEKFPYSATSYGREESKGDYREDKRNLFENNTDILLKYSKNINNTFDIKAWGGGNLRTMKYSSNYTTTDYLNTPGLYNFANSLRPVRAFNYNAEMEVQSAYYSVDLGFKNWLTLSTTGRLDKLSTLPQGSNTFFYPSVGASLVLSDLFELPQAVSFLKLRATYANVKDGLTSAYIGTNPGASFPLGYGADYSTSYDGPNYANSVGYGISPSYNNNPGAGYSNRLSNPGLEPNTTEQIEYGLEANFIKNRLSLDVTRFVSNDGPRIFSRDLSETTGYTNAIVNGINTQKKGWEISLKGNPVKTGKFSWDVALNWSTYGETLEAIFGTINELPSNYFVGGNSSNRTIKIGDRIDQVFIAAFARTTDGQIINDSGGRPIVLARGQNYGNALPDYIYGLNNKFTLGDVFFSFQLDGRVGGVIENYIRRQTFRGGRHIETTEGALGLAREQDTKGIKSYVGEGVKITSSEGIKFDPSTGQISNMSALTFAQNDIKTYAQDYVSRYNSTAEGNMMKKTFSKLREVTLGYTIPKSMLNGKFIKGASISFVGRNLFYFIDKKNNDVDLDPYTGLSAGTGVQTPTTKRYGINLNVNF